MMITTTLSTRSGEGAGLTRDTSPESGNSDNQIINQVALGNRIAFSELYHRYAKRIRGFLRCLLDRQDLIDEALNDTMLVVWTKSAEFDERRRLSTWIFGIAHNVGSKLKSKQRRHAANQPLNYALPSLITTESPLQAYTKTETLEIVVQGLTQLTCEHRAALELTFIEGMTYAEVADVVRCPVSTVKSRVFYARQALKSFVLDSGVDTHSDEHLTVS